MNRSVIRVELSQHVREDSLENLPFAVSEKVHFDRDIEQPLLELVRKFSQIQDPLAVLLGRCDNRSRIVLHNSHYPSDVGFRVVVVVGEFETGDDTVLVAQVHSQRSVLGYPGEEDKLL